MTSTDEILQASKPHANTTARRKPARSRFRFSLDGFTLLIIIGLVGFAAWHSGTNLLYLIFAILITFFLLQGLVIKTNIARLSATLHAPETVTAGHPFAATFEVQNHKRLFPSHGLRLTSNSPDFHAPVVFAASIPPHNSISLPADCTALRRGYHTLSAATLQSRYPFGFTVRTVQLPLHHPPILALPATYPVSRLASQLPAGLGERESRVKGQGTDLYGLRDYEPGEHSRHIHWRASARAQKLVVAEHLREERHQVLLRLNNSLPAENHQDVSDSFENAIILTASLARHYLDKDYEVGLATASAHYHPGSGSQQLLQILRHLAVIQLVPPAPVPGQSHNSVSITFCDPELQPQHQPSQHQLDARAWHPPGPSTATPAGLV